MKSQRRLRLHQAGRHHFTYLRGDLGWLRQTEPRKTVTTAFMLRTPPRHSATGEELHWSLT